MANPDIINAAVFSFQFSQRVTKLAPDKKNHPSWTPLFNPHCHLFSKLFKKAGSSIPCSQSPTFHVFLTWGNTVTMYTNLHWRVALLRGPTCAMVMISQLQVPCILLHLYCIYNHSVSSWYIALYLLYLAMRKSLFLSPYIIRPYYFQYVRRTSWLRFYTTQNTFEPLRILFCGSDDFSIASLQALYREHQEDKDLVASLDVVCRPAKPVGRGLKEVRPGSLPHTC